MATETDLKVFAVGDSDYYVAHCVHHALYLANEDNGPAAFDLDEVHELTEAELDAQFPEIDDNECKTGRTTSIRDFYQQNPVEGRLCGSDY